MRQDKRASKYGQPNFKPKTIWTGDNLLIMRGMNSACVDAIYLDPPFNSKRNYVAPIGSEAAGAEFKDTWSLTDIDEEWIDLRAEKEENQKLYRVLLSAMTDSDKSYLVYMAVRLLEMKRLLKDTGSIYLHCDPTMSHYLKILIALPWFSTLTTSEAIGSLKSRMTGFVVSSQRRICSPSNRKQAVNWRICTPYNESKIPLRRDKSHFR